MLIKRKLLMIYSILSISFFSHSVSAQDFTLVTQEFHGQTDRWADDQMGGLGGEIVTKAFAAAKLKFKINWMPWKRAQDAVLENSEKNAFILPLTRNKTRESKYNWVVKIYDNETAFYTLKKNKPINDMSDAQGKKIGVLLASSYELTILDPKNGFKRENIISYPKDSLLIKKLESGAIDAWYTGIMGAAIIIHDEKLNSKHFFHGKTIDKEANYLATSKKTSKEITNKVQKAVEKFKKTPEFKALVKKYYGKNY
ncbi:substrate-binding periplasmic protein [Silvanigrella aquatica]|uniref:Solute-binding protein family 3/N-terminal domain-containing protein n=1 Tax=Silvanigrella aquatica TaxID=1915309 RepID=A0A1L4D0L0_9BACT|nr:transporter substrate-binding domain-containing protein [Silvanigrella aquatica]APJ03752.1 hypothetical protein AXG55_07465 [Silvanigrella aquatica]